MEDFVVPLMITLIVVAIVLRRKDRWMLFEKNMNKKFLGNNTLLLDKQTGRCFVLNQWEWTEIKMPAKSKGRDE